MEQKNVSPVQSPGSRRSPTKNPVQIEEQSKRRRRSPRKNPVQSEEQRTSHMSVLLFSYKLLIMIFFFIINKEMNQMFMPFYIFSKVKLQGQLPGNVSKK